ncbi:hypothetical protein CSUI_005670 [Cystoisospora suis]|uniref:Uncharacterized protein n=1 Tax=Cystoisospora suis TaxID=483139 RepID=A0A2C6KX56_9APIC|nr:hypothetical protein CSUI_005670 [Cystoisospora suis]
MAHNVVRSLERDQRLCPSSALRSTSSKRKNHMECLLSSSLGSKLPWRAPGGAGSGSPFSMVSEIGVTFGGGCHVRNNENWSSACWGVRRLAGDLVKKLRTTVWMVSGIPLQL